jgi:hypothetical protein
MNSLEVIEFHKNLNMELNKIKDESQRNMIQHLLQFVGFLPIPIDKPEPGPPHQSFVTNVITTMRQKVEEDGSWTDTMSKTVTDAVESAKNAVKKKTAEMSAMATSVVASNAASVASVAASNAASVAPAQKSFFSPCLVPVFNSGYDFTTSARHKLRSRYRNPFAKRISIGLQIHLFQKCPHHNSLLV